MFIRILLILKKNSWQKLLIVRLGILKKGCKTEKEHKYFSDKFKNVPTWLNLTCYPRFINAFLMFLDGQLCQIVVTPERRFQSF